MMENPKLTLDLSTLAMLVFNVVVVVGAHYQLKLAIERINVLLDALREEVHEVKEKARERGQALDKLITSVAVLRGGHPKT